MSVNAYVTVGYLTLMYFPHKHANVADKTHYGNYRSILSGMGFIDCNTFCEISGSQDDEYEDDCLLECGAV
jgi:hypothetical protein